MKSIKEVYEYIMSQQNPTMQMLQVHDGWNFSETRKTMHMLKEYDVEVRDDFSIVCNNKQSPRSCDVWENAKLLTEKDFLMLKDIAIDAGKINVESLGKKSTATASSNSKKEICEKLEGLGYIKGVENGDIKLRVSGRFIYELFCVLACNGKISCADFTEEVEINASNLDFSKGKYAKEIEEYSKTKLIDFVAHLIFGKPTPEQGMDIAKEYLEIDKKHNNRWMSIIQVMLKNNGNLSVNENSCSLFVNNSIMKNLSFDLECESGIVIFRDGGKVLDKIFSEVHFDIAMRYIKDTIAGYEYLSVREGEIVAMCNVDCKFQEFQTMINNLYIFVGSILAFCNIMKGEARMCREYISSYC